MGITLLYKDLIIYVENYSMSPYLKNMVETSIGTDRVNDIPNGYNMNILDELGIDKWDLFHYCSYLNNGLIGIKHINLVLLDYMGHDTTIHKDLEYYACSLRDKWGGLIELEVDNVMKYMGGSIDRYWSRTYISILDRLFPDMDYVVSGEYVIEKHRASYVDVFFIGPDSCRVLELLENNTCIEIFSYSPNIVTISVYGCNIPCRINLKRYETLSDILYSHELDCQRIAIYRERLYSTWKAKYEIENKTIVVDCNNTTESYIKDLMVYKNKGYELYYPKEG